MEPMVVEVLLVEDNPNDAELTLHALKKNKLANQLHVVHDGVEALEYLFATGKYEGRGHDNPRVILLDLKLPKVDGLEVLRRLREDPRTARVPVVVLTSSQEDKDLAESYRLGANSYIVKPLDWEQFTRAVQEVGMYWLLLNHAPAPVSGEATRRPV